MKDSITVIASYNTGFVIYSDRLPSMGETKKGYGFRMEHGGKGSNQAIQAARLGGKVKIVASIGDDIFGKRAREKWSQEGVGELYVKVNRGVPTGVGIILVDKKGNNMIVVDLGANQFLEKKDIDMVSNELLSSDILLGQLENPVDTVLHAMKLAVKDNVTTILNPAPAHPLSPNDLEGINIITPNETEIKIMAGLPPDSNTDLISIARAYAKKVGHVIVTLGEKGALIVDSNGHRTIPPPKINPIDSTGAGDSFNGALAFALSRGYSIDEAVKIANHAAAFLVARFKRGELVESLPTISELREFAKDIGL